ncbi:MAG: beta-N-acetylglucosaminidase domain-containing protein [Halieaceae bacterium]
MTAQSSFLTGVVEGFYGRPWTHAMRVSYAGYLARLGLNSYLYCPKADPYLRKQWQLDWPDTEWAQLLELAGVYRTKNVLFGVGLSPFALYKDYNAESRAQLKAKIQKLNSLNAPLLAILFDDMPGDVSDLAARQADIVADVKAWSNAGRLLVCPTYYSDDPVLETHFGQMPEGYWQRLGEALDSDIDLFWTGPQVCSEAISSDDLTDISGALGRGVVLWDNYPVNDGAKRSNHLYCQPLARREPNASELRGHFCNPMNQALLSLPALMGLSELYQGSVEPGLLETVLGEDTWSLLSRDRADFEALGLSGIGASSCADLAKSYDVLPGEAAQEVAGWLRGEYTFDPACLTD